MSLKLFGSKHTENGAIAQTFWSAVYNRYTRARKKQVDALFSGRSDRPKNEGYAPRFLNAVYKRSTQVKKFQAETSLCGRSMVEMLGVLAIIGVLSVGGLTGYSRAMFKYKLNKQAEQLNTIISAVSRYQKELRLNDGSIPSFSLIPYLKKLNEIPPEMYVKNRDETISDIFNTRYSIYHHNTNYVGISMTFQRSQLSDMICRNIYMTSKSFSEHISYLEIGKVSIKNPQNGMYGYTGFAYGDRRCTKDRTCLKDLTQEKADKLCNQCSNENTCSLYIIF